jgi:hypothetical protein
MENPEKNPRSKGENQQTTQLTYDGESRNLTRATVATVSNLTTTSSVWILLIFIYMYFVDLIEDKLSD